MKKSGIPGWARPKVRTNRDTARAGREGRRDWAEGGGGGRRTRGGVQSHSTTAPVMGVSAARRSRWANILQSTRHEHHQKEDFKAELLRMLRLREIEFDERYVFD